MKPRLASNPLRFFSILQHYSLGFLILVTLTGGLVYSLILGDALRFLPDESDYTTLAENLVLGKGYTLDGEQPSAYRAPGYPLILAVIHWFGGGILAYRMANFGFVALSLVLVYLILRREGAAWASYLGPVLALGYPITFFTAGTLYPQTLAVLLLFGALYWLTSKQVLSGAALLGGIALGALILTVPTFFSFLILLIVWRLFFRFPKPVKWIGLTIIPVILLLGVWTVRNYQVFGTLFFVSTNSGENLLLGNSEHTLPNAGANVDIETFRAEAAPMSETERDQYFRDQALAWIKDNPVRAVKLYISKTLNFFNYQNDLVTDDQESHLKNLLMLVTYGPLLAALLLRLALFRKFLLSPFEHLLVWTYLLSAFVSAVFFTRIRFRLPYDYLLVLLVSLFAGKRITIFNRSTNHSHLERIPNENA